MKKFLVFAVVLSALLLSGCKDNPYAPDQIPTIQEIFDEITYSTSELNDTLTAYIFQPVTFEARINSADDRYVDSIAVRFSDSLSFEALIPDMLTDSSYTWSHTYSDPGEYLLTCRLFTMSGDYKDTTFLIRIGLSYSGMPINTVYNMRGDSVTLIASGIRDSGAMWHWDLSRIGGGEVVSTTDTTKILITGSYADSIILSQVDTLGRRSPGVTIPFKTSFNFANRFTYSVPQLNDTINALVFFPVTFNVGTGVNGSLYLDSIGVRFSDTSRYSVQTSKYEWGTNYPLPGSYKIDCRWYMMGEYKDTSFTVRIGMDYAGVPVDVLFNSLTGERVGFRATGSKHSDVSWRWDFTRIGGDVIVRNTDTVSLLIGQTWNDSIVLSQVDTLGRQSPGVLVPVKTGLNYLKEIAVTASATSVGVYEPVVITAGITGLDTGKVGNVHLYDGISTSPIALTAANGYSRTLAYADTGSYAVRVRIFSSWWEDRAEYKDTLITVRVGVGFSADPINYTMMTTQGGMIDLKVNGSPLDGFLWHWDLTGIGMTSVTASKDTAIHIDREVTGTILLSRVKDDGQNTIAVSVPIKTVFYRIARIPFTITKVATLAFEPITLTVIPADDDINVMDSMQLVLHDNGVRRRIPLTSANEYTATFDFADVGNKVCSLQVFETRFGRKDTTVTVAITIDYSVVGTYSKEYMLTEGTTLPLTVRPNSTKPAGVWYGWDLTRIGRSDLRVSDDGDTTLVIAPGEILNDTIFLYQTKTDTIDGAPRTRVSQKIAVPVNVSPKKCKITITHTGTADSMFIHTNPNDFTATISEIEIFAGQDTSFYITNPCHRGYCYSPDTIYINGVGFFVGAGSSIVNDKKTFFVPLSSIVEDTEITFAVYRFASVSLHGTAEYLYISHNELQRDTLYTDTILFPIYSTADIMGNNPPDYLRCLFLTFPFATWNGSVVYEYVDGTSHNGTMNIVANNYNPYFVKTSKVLSKIKIRASSDRGEIINWDIVYETNICDADDTTECSEAYYYWSSFYYPYYNSFYTAPFNVWTEAIYVYY